MKLKTTFTIIFSLLTVLVTLGQTIDETFCFAEKQFLAGNYQSALLEYKRVAFFDNNNKFNNIYQKIGKSFYAVNNFKSAAKNFDIAARITTDDSLSAEMYFKKALCYFKQDNYFFALNELLGLQVPTSLYFQRKYNFYTAIAWFGIEEYETAYQHLSKIIGNESISQLTDVFNQFKKTRKRFNPQKIQTLSTIFPGLGQIYCGNIYSGLNSIILIGGVAIITVYIWQSYSFLDAFLSMSSWYYRYYSGGIKNAKSIAIDKISHEKEKTYQKFIQLFETTTSSEK
jgi:tetratricopeptide (TPR) repeat protein